MKISKSVGEEVIEWAEQYWLIDKMLKNKSREGEEGFSYDYFRKVFVNKINLTITQRIEPEDYDYECSCSIPLKK
jgi:hypothetical protein